MDESVSSDQSKSESDSSKTTDDKPSSDKYDYEYSDDDLKNNKFTTEELKRIQKVEKATNNVWEVISKYGNAPLPSLDPNDISNVGWKIDKDSVWSDVRTAMKEIAAASEDMKNAWEDNDDADDSRKDSLDSSYDQSNDDWWKPILSSDGNSSSSSYDRKGETHTESAPLSKEEQTQFEQFHMEWATNAFAEELEALRNGQLENQCNKNSAKNKRGENDREDDFLDLNPNEHSFVVAKRNKPSEVTREDVDVQILAEMIRSGGTLLSDDEKRMLLRARQRGEKHPNRKESDKKTATIHDIRRRELGFL
jgi:hypothetical protein